MEGGITRSATKSLMKFWTLPITKVFYISNKPSCDQLLGRYIIDKNWWSTSVCSQKWALLEAIPNFFSEKVPHQLLAAMYIRKTFYPDLTP